MSLGKVLSFDSEVCTGCKVCEIVCSLRHTGTCNVERARLRLYAEEDFGWTKLYYCRRCKEPRCASACPIEGALAKDKETGVMVINRAKCIGCRECVEACPFGAMFFDPVTEEPICCDLCGGDPACAKFCSVKAITYGPPGARKGKERWYYKRVADALSDSVIKASTFRVEGGYETVLKDLEEKMVVK